MSKSTKAPKAGPDPLLLSRKEVDVLYDVFDVVRKALALLNVEYIVTGGSLLGAIRQHSILFCDDDIDIAVIDHRCGEEDGGASAPSIYESVVVPRLQSALDEVVADESNDCRDRCVYQIKPWEGGDRIRSKRYNSVFVDLFVLRKYPTLQSFRSVVGVKRNGRAQPEAYVDSILDTVQASIGARRAGNRDSHGSVAVVEDADADARARESVFPFWQFATRKAIEMWPKEVYCAAGASSTEPSNHRESPSQSMNTVDELFPLQTNLKLGPLTGVCGPNMPVTLLKRAFGDDCFDVYYRSLSHHQQKQSQNKSQAQSETQQQQQQQGTEIKGTEGNKKDADLPPLVAPGGTWEDSPKVPLEDEHYLPMQPLARKRRRPTLHCKERLFEFLDVQAKKEAEERERFLSLRQPSGSDAIPPSGGAKTVYMDGVFDLFHVGHLEAIRQCAELGTRVILGVTGDEDATGYKRKPVVPQAERVAIVSALEQVDAVVCPCPLVVTKEFMDAQKIDLVVHGFANDADAERQKEFFEVPMALGKFQRIGYYRGLSTTDRIRTIQERDRQDQHRLSGDGENQAKDGSDEQLTIQTKGGEEEKEDSVAMSVPSDVAEPRIQNGDGAGRDSLANETAPTKTASQPNPQWFGAALAAATNDAPLLPTDPFPLSLRTVIEPHIEKARRRRREALGAIRAATGEPLYDSVMKNFLRQQEQLRVGTTREPLEGNNSIDRKLSEGLLSSLLLSAGLPPDTDLSRLHEIPLLDGRPAKDRLLHSLTQNPGPFQTSYDAYVRTVCIPRMASAIEASERRNGNESFCCEEIYYQAFPCLRIVQPHEFSIGPHADVAYGHHPCSINCYVSLTDPTYSGISSDINGDEMGSSPSSSLFLESRPGAEDWHALFSGNDEGFPRLELFAGAMNLHWTTENKTPRTRVSLDFRLLDGRVFQSLKCGGHLEGGQMDVYRATPGYYHRCLRSKEPVTKPVAQNKTKGGTWDSWIRDKDYLNNGSGGEFPHPDFRVGFPWTVKNWDKFWRKNTKPDDK